MKTKSFLFRIHLVLLAMIVAVGSVSLPQTRATTITQSGDPIGGGAITSGTTFTVGSAGTTMGVNNWPSSENPAEAIDGIMSASNKYLNFFELNTGYIVTPTVGP